MQVVSAIHRTPIFPDQKFGFSVWARGEPKPYLAEYPRVAKTIAGNHGLKSHALLAIVDDVLPAVQLSRSADEQNRMSELYRKQLPELGFDEVCFVSDIVPAASFGDYLKFASGFTSMQFMKLLPETKKAKSELKLTEVIGFLWHLRVMEVAIERFSLTGFLAGVRSEFFYLAARQVLQPHDVHFLGENV